MKKNIKIIILLIMLSFNTTAQDIFNLVPNFLQSTWMLSDYGLRGNVKNVKMYMNDDTLLLEQSFSKKGVLVEDFTYLSGQIATKSFYKYNSKNEPVYSESRAIWENFPIKTKYYFEKENDKSVESLIFKDGQTWVRVYDNTKKIKKIMLYLHEKIYEQSEIYYDSNNKIAKIVTNFDTSSYLYNDKGLIKEIFVKNSSPYYDLSQKIYYEYDEENRLTHIQSNEKGITGSITSEAWLSYDAENNIKELKISDSNGGNNQVFSFEYDKKGNWVKKQDNGGNSHIVRKIEYY